MIGLLTPPVVQIWYCVRLLLINRFVYIAERKESNNIQTNNRITKDNIVLYRQYAENLVY